MMDPRHAGALAEAAQRTRLSLHEETFCLLGLAQRDSTYLILAIVKPEQRAEVRRFGQAIMSSVYSRPCPTGTIASLHTHPFGSPHPSWIDASGWIQNRRYTPHLIAVAGSDINRVHFAAYDYSTPNRPRGLPTDWLRLH